MATNTNLKAHESNVIVGLGTYTHVAASTGMYTMEATSSINPASSLSITISQSGSTTASATSTAPSSTQNNVSIRKIFNGVAGDVLTAAITSSNPNDQQLNSVKTIVKVNPGEV